jgi:hypothetical protein
VREPLLPLSIVQKREDVVACKPIPALQECEFQNKAQPHHVALAFLDKPRYGARRTAGRKYIVNDQDILAGFDAVRVDLQRVLSVFEVIFNTPDYGRELLRFSHRNEPRPERMGHSRGEEISSGLNSDHDVNRPTAIVRSQGLDRLVKTAFVFQQSGNVVKLNAGLRKIGTFPNKSL